MSARGRGGRRGRGRAGPAPERSSSGRVIKHNAKYGEIQGRVFERVVGRLVGPDDSEGDSDGEPRRYSEGSGDQDSSGRLGVDLGPDSVTRCVVCWSECTPAPAAAEGYNRLNRYLASCGDSPVQMAIGALSVDLDAAAKFELICPSCAALVRQLEDREQEVLRLRQQLLDRLRASRQPPPPLTAAQQEQLELQEQEKALNALRADSQAGMFGMQGLGVPPPAETRTAAAWRGGQPAGPAAAGSDPLQAAAVDTVEAYLSRRDEWITQTPGAADGLARAVVEASADGLGTRFGPRATTHPCSECERVFSAPDALARHEYFRHRVGPPPAAAQTADQAEAEAEAEAEDEDAEPPAPPRKRGRPRLPDNQALRSGTCQYCGTFIKVDLQGHVNRFHTMVCPFECALCGKRLVSRHALAEHRQVEHSSGHKCDLCGTVFARKKQLSMHQWRKHGVGGVQCRVCGKKFARSDTLDGHMRCHERPLQCSLCPARFPFKRELRNHEHLKHGLHGEIPRDSDHRPGEMYRCGKCGRCFGSWAGRARHACDSSAALSDLYVCQLCGDWSTRFEGDMVKHMRNLHQIEAETILIADVEEADEEAEAAAAGDGPPVEPEPLAAAAAP